VISASGQAMVLMVNSRVAEQDSFNLDPGAAFQVNPGRIKGFYDQELKKNNTLKKLKLSQLGY
jgi:hypothetical protein